MTIRNILLSLVLSVTLTVIGTLLYVFYPVLRLIVGGFFKSAFSSNTHTDGIAVVAGGVSTTVLPIALVMASVLFLLIFTLLQRRSDRR